MEFQYKYFGQSQVSHSADKSALSFAPDTLRSPTYFSAQLNRHIPFREAMSALHEIVVSDFRFQPRDKSDYKAWLASQDEIFMAQALQYQNKSKAHLEQLQSELRDLNQTEYALMKPFYTARAAYYNYLYSEDIDAWFVLDPVITVHPDSLFFECFSQDESSYGKLSCSYEVFQSIQAQACGTTNIDYSHALYQEFQKIRDYKPTQFVIDPSGFEVQTADGDAFKEEKIDLPDSWVRGFLQVSSAMHLPMTRLDLHPMDVYNLLSYLRQHKEKSGPRSLRFELEPGRPVVIVVEPWNLVLTCPRSVYTGPEARHIRIWGRRRLFVLERLLPVCRNIQIHLLGTGMPSFWIAEMPEMSFTLGLSGWSANDFSRAGQFDLMAPRGQVDRQSAQAIFACLQSSWFARAQDLAKLSGKDLNTVRAAMSLYAQSGRVLYDLQEDCYRIRELSREALPVEDLRYANEREARAERFVQAGLVELELRGDPTSACRLKGKVTDNAQEYPLELEIDSDLRLVNGSCKCHFYYQNHLRQGPCEHLLALRLANGI